MCCCQPDEFCNVSCCLFLHRLPPPYVGLTAHFGVDILAGLMWPLPENMAYQNAEMLIGGHDGLPIGDLNWFPDMREQYVEPTEITTALNEPTATASTDYQLGNNFPNPFSDKTIISFNIPRGGMTTLKVYDMFGKEIETLVNKELKAGKYEYEFNTGKLISGNYFYQLQSGDYTGIKKMIILRQSN